MSLEQTATLIEAKLRKIQETGYKIAHLCELVKTVHSINGDVFQYNTEDKQKLIQHAQTSQVQLEQFVSELHDLIFPS